MFAKSQEVSRVTPREPTRETVEEIGLAGASMAHAITRADLVPRLLEAALRLDADAPDLASALRLAVELLRE